MSMLERQMIQRDKEMVPKILIQGMFTVMVLSLLLVGYARLTDRPLVGVPKDTSVVVERPIYMEGTREGAVTVRDENGAVLAHSDDDMMGFVGVIWRVIDRERMSNGVRSDAPVRLVRRENGHVAIIDDTTGWKMELIGYGPDNIAAFDRLID